MLKRTEGIVLRSFVFGEADLIVTYLTRNYGLLKVFAKSPRKIKSRFGSSLEPLTYSRISFIGKEDAVLPRLTQSDIIKNFHSLRNSLRCFSDVSVILELILRFLPEREPNFKAFELLLNTLLKLESDCSNRLYYLYYKIRFLELTGYSARLDTCGRCGSAADNGHHNFYTSHGSIICEKCFDGGEGAIRLSEGTLRFYRSILKWNFGSISRVNAPEYFLSEVTNILDAHVAYILGLPKSFSFQP